MNFVGRAAAAVVGHCGAGQPLAEGLLHGGLLYRGVLVPSKQFSVSVVEEMSRKFLSASRKVTYKRLDIFTDRADAGHAATGSSGFYYPDWYRWFAEYAKNPAPMAQVMAAGESAVLRIRDSSGRVSRRVLEGTDVFRFEVTGVSCDVVDLSSSASQETDLFLLVKTSELLSPEAGEEVVRTLMRVMRLPMPSRMLVAMRADPWFVECRRLFILYKFEPPQRPPTEAEYRLSTTLHCGVHDGAISCSYR